MSFTVTINYRSPAGRPATRRFPSIEAESALDAIDAAHDLLLTKVPGARIDGGDVIENPAGELACA